MRVSCLHNERKNVQNSSFDNFTSGKTDAVKNGDSQRPNLLLFYKIL